MGFHDETRDGLTNAGCWLGGALYTGSKIPGLKHCLVWVDFSPKLLYAHVDDDTPNHLEQQQQASLSSIPFPSFVTTLGSSLCGEKLYVGLTIRDTEENILYEVVPVD